MPADIKQTPETSLFSTNSLPDPPPSIFSRIDRWVLLVNRSLMIVTLALMSIIVFAAVMVRYTSDVSIPWAEEVARYLMIWLTFLGIGPVLRVGGHVAIESLQDALVESSARLLRVLVLSICAGFCVLLSWSGVMLMERTVYQTTAVTEISFAWVSAAVPVGAVLSLWHLAAFAGRYVRRREFDKSSDLNSEEIAV